VPVLVEARDGQLAPLGALTWTKLEATLRYNAVGSWSLTMPATEANRQLTRVWRTPIRAAASITRHPGVVPHVPVPRDP
jgi:hypothetical protein